ncbi:S8 family peptidase [Sphingobacterium deserti]|uniref:Peptidase S8 and S53 subtilisin kexin sedolisin n=1 Tax=Sphingobacterium deserti TaxID=1229276 RepID=A0A0B8T0S2_9SPHI|nr:S8 family peptidase [Sphingobacterium deserti]KGE14061.1 peptidase S8 and S53 subtilisin kexin sedolisin [Sphingobacterium deserti]
MIGTSRLCTLIGIALLPYFGSAQSKSTNPPNWYNLDYQADGVRGISTEKAYELLKGRKSTPVIVGVLDGGVDYKHEDLKDVMWTNKKEVAGDGKDNDGNGYIDDIHGWNFIGNATGENVQYDNLEVTRLIRLYEPKYISVLPSTPLTEEERREFVAYQKMISDYTSKLDQANFGNTNYVRLKEELDIIIKKIGKDPKDITKADLDSYTATSDRQKMALRMANRELANTPFDKFYKDLEDGVKYFSGQTKYHLNKAYDSRSIVGDNYENASERDYGNPDIKGPDADHGTHVAGIIGAKRDNGIGINGVADNVQIMGIRLVPDGDERDKDVANGIRYAVANGAKVINMSFGKGYVYNKETVDEAVKYAEENDVLLVHAAGNDSKDNDIVKNYPMKYFTDSLGAVLGEASNWITVGATSSGLDDDLLASFSNYGYKSVDVFAPGVKINSTMPESTYKEQDGTSMAAPVVAGLAALIRSYYPELSAKEVKSVILKSVTKVDDKVKIQVDGSTKKVYLDEISVTGGIVNAKRAVEEANNYIQTKK